MFFRNYSACSSVAPSFRAKTLFGAWMRVVGDLKKNLSTLSSYILCYYLYMCLNPTIV